MAEPVVFHCLWTIQVIPKLFSDLRDCVFIGVASLLYVELDRGNYRAEHRENVIYIFIALLCGDYYELANFYSTETCIQVTFSVRVQRPLIRNHSRMRLNN